MRYTLGIKYRKNGESVLSPSEMQALYFTVSRYKTGPVRNWEMMFIVFS